MVFLARRHDCGACFRQFHSRKSSYHDIAGCQRPYCSCSSNRFIAARLASAMSSSLHESDQSMAPAPANSESRWAQLNTLAASSDGSCLISPMSDSSLEVRTMPLLYAHRPPAIAKVQTELPESLRSASYVRQVLQIHLGSADQVRLGWRCGGGAANPLLHPSNGESRRLGGLFELAHLFLLVFLQLRHVQIADGLYPPLMHLDR